MRHEKGERDKKETLGKTTGSGNVTHSPGISTGASVCWAIRFGLENNLDLNKGLEYRTEKFGTFSVYGHYAFVG